MEILKYTIYNRINKKRKKYTHPIKSHGKHQIKKLSNIKNHKEVYNEK
jgi:hypothetical protein